MKIAPTLEFATNAFNILYTAMAEFATFMTSSLNDIGGTSLNGIFWNYPLYAILLGAGFSAFVIVMIAKWLIDIIT